MTEVVKLGSFTALSENESFETAGGKVSWGEVATWTAVSSLLMAGGPPAVMIAMAIHNGYHGI